MLRHRVLYRYLPPAVAVVILALLNFILLYPLHRSMDVPLWDEAGYMSQGWDFVRGRSLLPELTSSPLYSLAYGLFSIPTSTFGSIYLMTYITGLVLPILLFFFLYKYSKHAPLALLLAMIYSISEHHVSQTYTFTNGTSSLNTILIYRFAAILWLLSLLLPVRSVAALLALVLCVFARQEYLFALVPYALYLGFCLLRERRHLSERPSRWLVPRLSLRHLPAVALAFVLVFLLINVPGWGNGTGRGWFAFNQHYALAAVLSGSTNIDPWVDYQQIITRDFPGASSLREALLVNPEALLYHISKNVMLLPSALTAFIIPTVFLQSPPLLAAIFVMLGALAYGILSSLVPVFQQHLRGEISANREVLILATCGLFAVAPSTVVFAKTAYLLPVLPLLFLAPALLYRAADLALVASSDSTRPGQRYLSSTLLGWLPVVASFVVFVAILGMPKPMQTIPSARPNRDSMVRLAELLPPTQVRLAALGAGNYRAYLGSDRVETIELLRSVVGMSSESVDLASFIAGERPDALVISTALLSSAQFDQASLDSLSGWVMYPIGTDQLYVRPALAARPSGTPQGFEVSQDLGVLLSEGWYDYERDYGLRWMQGRGSIWVYADAAATVSLELVPLLMHHQNSFSSAGQLAVALNAEEVWSGNVEAERPVEISLQLTRGMNQLVFELASGDFVPAEQSGGSGDTRRLGVAFKSIKLRSGSS